MAAASRKDEAPETAKSPEATKTTGAETQTPTPATESDVRPVSPAGLQQGESVGAPLSTRVPRGVNEPASDSIADEPAAAALQEHVKKVIDEEEERGFRGDPNKNRVPNSAYTLRGVGRGDPTPETTVITPSSK